MLTQPLLDKLVQLHLPAFREGLQEQLNNPKYAELAFEERLALLGQPLGQGQLAMTGASSD